MENVLDLPGAAFAVGRGVGESAAKLLASSFSSSSLSPPPPAAQARAATLARAGGGGDAGGGGGAGSGDGHTCVRACGVWAGWTGRLNPLFAECPRPGTQQSFFIFLILCRVSLGQALDKEGGFILFLKIFAECHRS